MFLDVFGAWMALDRKVAAIESIKKIEANWKIVAKASFVVTEDLSGIEVHEPIERRLEHLLAVAEQQSVFRGNEFERPGVVGHLLRQIGNAAS